MGAVITGSVLGMLLLSTALAAGMFLIVLEIAAASGSSGCIYPAGTPAGLSGSADPNSTDMEAAFLELVAMNWISASDRAVCVGPGSAAAAALMRKMGIHGAARASPTPRCGIPLEGEAFDFAFSAAHDRVRVPARLVLEMERVIRPGRFGAVLSGRRRGGDALAGIMRAAAPMAALLRASEVVGAREVGGGCAMVVFQKRPPTPSPRATITGSKMTKLSMVATELARVVTDILAFWNGPFRHMIG